MRLKFLQRLAISHNHPFLHVLDTNNLGFVVEGGGGTIPPKKGSSVGPYCWILLVNKHNLSYSKRNGWRKSVNDTTIVETKVKRGYSWHLNKVLKTLTPRIGPTYSKKKDHCLFEGPESRSYHGDHPNSLLLFRCKLVNNRITERVGLSWLYFT